LRVKRPRQIVILVDPDSEDRTALDAILQELAVVPDDLVILLNTFSGIDSNPPRVFTITAL
jgi:hypothetical protein